MGLLLVLGCQPAPPGLEGDAGDSTDEGAGQGVQSAFPLVDGAQWTYAVRDAAGVSRTEVVSVEAVDWQGAAAFAYTDAPDANGESSISILVDDGDVVVRVHKELRNGGTLTQRVEYDPGFLRIKHAWEVGERVDWPYERRQFGPTGTLELVEQREQSYELEAKAELVEVPAGSFECLRFVRERADNGDRDRFWFAPGVGKIKRVDLQSGSQEELVSFEIPT